MVGEFRIWLVLCPVYYPCTSDYVINCLDEYVSYYNMMNNFLLDRVIGNMKYLCPDNKIVI